jgi:hypothetical protein
MYGPLLISLLPPEPIGEAARTAPDPVPCIAVGYRHVASGLL